MLDVIPTKLPTPTQHAASADAMVWYFAAFVVLLGASLVVHLLLVRRNERAAAVPRVLVRHNIEFDRARAAAIERVETNAR